METRPDSAMAAVVRSLMRNRWRWMVLLGVLAGLAGWRARRLELDFSFRHFFLAEPGPDEFGAAIARHFGNNGGSYLVAVLEGDDCFRPDVLAALEDMSDAAERIPHVAQVFSLATVPFISGADGVLSFRPVAGLVPAGAELAAVRAAVLGSPLYVRRLVSPDGRRTAVAALLEAEHRGIDARRATIEAFRTAIATRLPARFAVAFTGYPIAEAEYGRLVWRGFLLAELVALVLMAIALFACFHALAGVALPLATVGIATILTLGFMEIAGQRVTLTNASVPLMMMVIGVAQVSFLVARYYEEAALGGAHREAVARAAARVIPPGLMAAATTSAAFAALATGHIGLTRDFGVTMAVGLLATSAVAVLLVPGVLSLLGRPPARALRSVKSGPLARLLAAIADLGVRRSRAIVLGAALLLLLGVIAAARLGVEQYATRDLRPDHPLRRAQEVVDAALTGAFQTQVVVRAADGAPVSRHSVLRAIDELEGFLASQPDVLKAWSVVDYLKELHMAAGGGRAELRRLPENENLISQYLLLLSSGGPGSDVPDLIDPTHRFAAIVLGTADLGTARLLALRRRTDAFVRERLGDLLEVRFAGDYWLVCLGADSLVRDLVVGVFTSFALVFGLVVLYFGSWRLTLLSIPPNLLPLAAALVLMGFGALPLRVGTSIILPVSLGTAVDSTIQYLARVREEWARDRNYAAATRRALLGAGRGMVFSALVLVLGFLALLVPEFLVFHDVGLLGAATMFCALLANLLLTPALVRWWRPFSRSEPAPQASPLLVPAAMKGGSP